MVVSDNRVVVPWQSVKVPVIAPTPGSAFTVTSDVVDAVQPDELTTVYVMLAVPAETPVTIPVVPTVATDVLPLVQAPPEVVLDKVVTPPTQTLNVPDIEPTDGSALTVTTFVTNAAHPKLFVTVYVTLAVPAATPETMPVEPTVATAILLLVHVPPPVVLASAVLAPTHTVAVPVIADTEGNELTVTIVVEAPTQPKLFESV